ncbi:type II secretion system protein [Limosilactobacillus equigenerosi]|uniref:Prepilin-type N-terminal cleavage/methylation domain-containing protein n=1 Tax=Limosilactobacillus equigenerosi DSM 18793 = JCM 14505 TaxID=1423742 RepID=A0A0R1UTS3_9LACO|nr:type II secretion system protein [Limosilactobacillus equigenerosi]KRL94792.1 hypothetical protein FC21_GL001258 [Limosilactobacillus equigenerosi DSM 18793 = JCM 14505]
MKRPAFTLVELLIVLGMVALMILLSGPQVRRMQMNLNEQVFWHRFRQQYLVGLQTARRGDGPTVIVYLPSKHQMYFQHFKAAPDARISVPKSLQVRNDRQVTIQNHTAYTAPQTWQLVNNDEDYQYAITFQMGGGEYHLRREKKPRFYSGRTNCRLNDYELSGVEPGNVLGWCPLSENTP